MESPLAGSITGKRIIERIRKSEERLTRKVRKKNMDEKEYYDNRSITSASSTIASTTSLARTAPSCSTSRSAATRCAGVI